MSSRQRQRHGRPPPAPDPSRQYNTSTRQHFDEYDEIESIQRQAAALNARVAALTTSATRSFQQNSGINNRPRIVSRTPSNSTKIKKQRNPLHEGSKHNFYAVHNGINGNEVFSSWHTAAPYCWDHKSQYFFKGTVCKGFSTYTQAWDWLLGINQASYDLPPVPPEYTYPQYPPNEEDSDDKSLHQDDQKATIPEYPPQDQNTMISDDQSEVTDYDYTTFIHTKPGPTSKATLPSHYNNGPPTTSSASYVDTLNNPTPFLTAGSEKALPKYSGKPSDDLNAFIFKLKIFLRHPSINNCHLQDKTDSSNEI